VLPAATLAVEGLTTTVSTGTAPGHTTLTLAVACIAPGVLVAVTV